MTAQRKSGSPGDTDLESTAELPVLDVAAYEATMAERELNSTDTSITHASTVSASLAQVIQSNAQLVEDERTLLELDLAALSTSLREVEERLTCKVRRLEQIEKDLEESRTGRAMVEERTRQLEADLTTARAGLAIAERQLEVLRQELKRSAEKHDAELQRANQARASAEKHFGERETRWQAERAAREQELQAKIIARDHSLTVASEEAQSLQVRLVRYFEVLQTAQARRGVLESDIAGLDETLLERDECVARLERELGSARVSASHSATKLVAQEQRVASLEKEVKVLDAALAERNALQSRLTALEIELATAKTQTTAQQAALAARLTDQEGKTRATEAARTELEAQLIQTRRHADDATGELIDARRQLEERTAALRNALDERTADLTEQLKDHETQLAARIETQQAELGALQEKHQAELRARIDEHAAALEAVQAEKAAHYIRLQAAEARVRELEVEFADQVESTQQVHKALGSAQTRSQELESAVRLAEDTINRLETELRVKTTCLEELTKTGEAGRNIVEQAKQSLAQKDAFIRRLKAEAAQSALLLGNIRQSVQRLTPSATSGSYEAIPEGVARLLICTDGGSEVMHVLGRRTTIGRAPENDVQIDTKFISRHHAVVLTGPNYTIIEDLKSTNGVLVNGRRVTRNTLKDGDSISIGHTPFRFAVRPAVPPTRN